MTEISADDIFKMWKIQVKDHYGKSRFTKTDRDEILDELAENLKRGSVEYDEAMWLKKKVIDFLVTKEGQKDSGRYKGWKDCVDEEFTAAILTYYHNDVMSGSADKYERQTKDPSKHYDTFKYLPRNRIIVEWARYKFGSNFTESICLECHRIGGSLNILFQKEVLKSKWVKSTDFKKPSWALAL